MEEGKEMERMIKKRRKNGKKMKVLTGFESWTYSFRLMEGYKMH
jgi:hypothetical protein